MGVYDAVFANSSAFNTSIDHGAAVLRVESGEAIAEDFGRFCGRFSSTMDMQGALSQDEHNRAVELGYSGAREPPAREREVHREMIQHIRERNIDGLRESIAKGADLSRDPGSDGIALSIAVHKWDIPMVTFLLAQGADPSVGTPLISAAHLGSLSIATALLAAGAELDAKEYSGRTALHYAESTPMAQLLIRGGANVDATWSGRTSFTMALQDQNRSLAKCLLRAGASTDHLPHKLNKKYPNENMVKEILKRGGWAAHALWHTRLLAGLVSKCAPLPLDAASHVVSFWCPEGGY